MAIINNEPCPACQEVGHDQRGSNLMRFEDGGAYCSRSHWHSSGKPYFEKGGDSSHIINSEITGEIKYTVKQFRELEEAGKLDSSSVRAIALDGMRGSDRWEVSTTEERQGMLDERSRDEEYFSGLRTKNLMSRHIRGDIAKFYNVRVGVDEAGKVVRHYYPLYGVEGNWKGAKCRTLPKSFGYGGLGWQWGDGLLFGQHTLQDTMDTGARMNTLLLVGGECDAMAAQQMLLDSSKGTKWEGQYFHVWSPTKGEKSLKEILAQREVINKFKKIIVGFDADETGEALNQEVARLFPAKTHKLVYPVGCKDANSCLTSGKAKEFVDSWWNPETTLFKGALKPVSAFKEQAKSQVKMGLEWPVPALNRVTFGIRPYFLGVWGAGTGVGKTEWTKEVVSHLAYVHGVPVMVIYLEEPPTKTVQSFAGKLVNKDFTVPACNDKSSPDYTDASDYTQEELDTAIDQLSDDGKIFIGDLGGRKDADSVLEVMEEARMMGIRHFVVDNLTAFQHVVDGKVQTGAVAIDETMRRLGTFKDEHPVHIMLLSHLIKVHPQSGRTPFNEGGEVLESDFRGAGSITFWANAVFGIVRNVKAPSLAEKALTYVESIKNRDNGRCVGDRVYMRRSEETGRYLPAHGSIDSFNTGE